MLLIYKNVEMFCKRNHISLPDLLTKLEIPEDVYYSERQSKLAKREREDVFSRIADYFQVPLEELEDRFFDEPKTMWDVRSDAAGFFEEIAERLRYDSQDWEMLDAEEVEKVICAQSKYFDFHKVYRCIAFRETRENYTLNIYNYATHNIVVDIERAMVTEERVYTHEPIAELIISGCPIQRFYAGDDSDIGSAIMEIFETLLQNANMTETDKWYLNPDYRSDFTELHIASYTFSIAGDISNDDEQHEDIWRNLQDTLLYLSLNTHITQEQIERLKEELYNGTIYDAYKGIIGQPKSIWQSTRISKREEYLSVLLG